MDTKKLDDIINKIESIDNIVVLSGDKFNEWRGKENPTVTLIGVVNAKANGSTSKEAANSAYSEMLKNALKLDANVVEIRGETSWESRTEKRYVNEIPNNYNVSLFAAAYKRK